MTYDLLPSADLVVTLFWAAVFLVVLAKLVVSIRIVPNRSAYVVERLGRYSKTLGPGFHALLPFLDKVAFVRELKEVAIDVPSQTCFTRDEVKVEVDGVIYMSVVDPVKASYGVIDYELAAIELAQTTTRSVIGTLSLDRTFEERNLISLRVVEVLDEAGHAWGLRVHRYEIKNITPPHTVHSAMEAQVTAERNRRAVVAKSEGDRQSRINLSEGQQREMINRSEGERQRMVNEAEGRAEEIRAIAEATAQSIETLAGALTAEGGAAAARLTLAEQLLETVAGLAQTDTRVVLPADLTDPDRLLGLIELSGFDHSSPPPAPAS